MRISFEVLFKEDTIEEYFTQNHALIEDDLITYLKQKKTKPKI